MCSCSPLELRSPTSCSCRRSASDLMCPGHDGMHKSMLMGTVSSRYFIQPAGAHLNGNVCVRTSVHLRIRLALAWQAGKLVLC